MHKYGIDWHDRTELEIELYCISRGDGFGVDLFDHYMVARKLAWPDRYQHEWTELMYREFIKNDITILVGCASSQKTSHASEFILLNYWARPHNTLCIVSTLKANKLELGVFGEIKKLFNKARDIHPDLAGNLIDHKHCIATDNLKEDGKRDLRKGIIGRACKEGNRWVGLGDLAGTKQDYVFYLADELQYMEPAFIGAWPNLFSNNTPAGGRVKIIGSGNPNHDPDDQLGIAAEPKCGWQSMGEPKETTTWPTRFMGGVTVNLVGTDSPNFRAVAKGLPEPYHGLIGPQFAARLAHDWGGEGSPQYYSQVKGVMRLDMANDRVITRQICREHKAFDKVTWQGGNITSIYFLDPSYGGKDACIGGILKFGPAIDGTIIVQIAMVKQLTIDLRIVDKMSVEDQIANQVADDLERHNIPVENCFYDPYGKGTIGFAFARRFGHTCPIPVDSGGKPTERPVRDDLYVYDKGKRRLKKCSEHYCKFVSEAWFSVRYTIEAGQLRELPEDVMLEGCARTYQMVGGNKIEIEPKDDYKERTGKSPNKFDGLAIGIEGCRQRGFRIGKLGEVEGDGEGLNWLAERSQNNRKLFSSKQLVHR